MDLKVKIKGIKIFLGAVLLTLVSLMALGCFGDPEGVVLDFSKTESSELPKHVTADTKRIRVAVGAMISPKETFTYYQRLLDYIGRKLGI